MIDSLSIQDNTPVSGNSVPSSKCVTPQQIKWRAAESITQKVKKSLKVSDNLSAFNRAILFISEICGTAMLVFLGCAGSLASNPLQGCLTSGLAIMLAIQCFGHISGAHINPIVTIAAAILGHIPLLQVPIYFVAQILGALAGFGLLKSVTPSHFLNNSSDVEFCSTELAKAVSLFQGFLVEFLISLMLVLACCAGWDCRNETKQDSIPLRLGLTISVLALAGAPYTGASMNPARSFAPALINRNWKDHWIYWVGPLTGGIVGALLYRFLFGKEPIKEEQISTPKVSTVQMFDKSQCSSNVAFNLA